MTDLAIVHCRQLVTLAGPPGARSGAAMRSLAIIADGALRIRGGRIAAVGPGAEIERSLSEDTAIVDAGGRIVLPGFIDAHTHPVFAGSRAAEFERRVEGATYAAIAASGGSIGTTVRQTREASAATLPAAGRRARRARGVEAPAHPGAAACGGGVGATVRQSGEPWASPLPAAARRY